MQASINIEALPVELKVEAGVLQLLPAKYSLIVSILLVAIARITTVDACI